MRALGLAFISFLLVRCGILPRCEAYIILVKCEAYRQMRQQGLDGYEGYSLNQWMCTVQYTSYFQTSHFKKGSDGFYRYGIFGIRGKEWCHRASWNENFEYLCDALQDNDITDDINCAKTIVRLSPSKMDTWDAFRNNCKDREIHRYDIYCA